MFRMIHPPRAPRPYDQMQTDTPAAPMLSTGTAPTVRAPIINPSMRAATANNVGQLTTEAAHAAEYGSPAYAAGLRAKALSLAAPMIGAPSAPAVDPKTQAAQDKAKGAALKFDLQQAQKNHAGVTANWRKYRATDEEYNASKAKVDAAEKALREHLYGQVGVGD